MPDDYVKIQWAIDNATAGDTIIVEDGVYCENICVNKSLTIIGNDSCVIDGGGGLAVNIPADDVYFDGVDVRNSSFGVHLKGSNNT